MLIRAEAVHKALERWGTYHEVQGVGAEPDPDRDEAADERAKEAFSASIGLSRDAREELLGFIRVQAEELLENDRADVDALAFVGWFGCAVGLMAREFQDELDASQ